MATGDKLVNLEVLKNTVQKEVVDLKTALPDIGDLGYVPADLGSIVRGAVYVENPMTVVTSTTRLTMADPVDLGPSIYVKCNGQKFLCYVYDASNNFASSRSIKSWEDDDTLISIPSGYKVRLLFSTINNDPIYPYDRTVTVSRIAPLAQSVNSVAYFSAGTKPIFEETLNGASSTLDCTFPVADFRIYHCGSPICNTNAYSNTKFQLSNLKKLVWNIGSGTVSVIDSTNNAINIIDLLCLSGESVTGLLSGYYYSSKVKIFGEAIDGLDGDITQIEAEIDALDKKDYGVYAYFSNGLSPVFSESLNTASSTISVTFPSAEFRLYKGDGSRILVTSAYSGQTFNLTLLQKLAYDPTDGTLKVSSASQSDADRITILGLFGESVSGCLLPYYIRWKEKTRLQYDNPRVYFSAGQTPTFERIGRVESTKYIIQFPDAQFRIYSNAGLVINTTSFARQIYTVSILEKLVFNKAANTVSVVSATAASDDYINLFCNDGDGISGLLSQFCLLEHDPWIEQDYYDIKSVFQNATASFAFFSDIHGEENNMARIVNKCSAWSNNISAIINGGDTVASDITQSLQWYNDQVDLSNIDVLTCIGNHDTWTNQETWAKASQIDVYNAEIAPVISKVQNIVQPTGASSAGLCYYYKDYSSVRVIVLDAMTVADGAIGYWNDAENTWLQSVLSDAKTNDKSVVIVAHPPFKKSIALRDDSNVNSWMDYRTASYMDEIHVPEAAMNTVKDYIDGGGKFVCWLSGHTHIDNVLTATGYPGQVMINIASARARNHMDGVRFYITAYSREKWYDCYDIIGIDTTNGMIKVYRVGYNMDAAMKVRTRFSYDYMNSRLITVS